MQTISSELSIIEILPYTSPARTTRIARVLDSLVELDKGKVLIIRGQEVEFDATNIYFLTGLSHRGERPRMGSVWVIGESLDMFIARVCPGAHKSPTCGKIQIPIVEDLPLRVLLFMITRVAGSQAQHEATKTKL